MSYVDPFTALMEGIWALLENNQSFNKVVPVSNRIKLTYGATGGGSTGELRKPTKDVLTNTDVPEVMVYPSSMVLYPDGERDSSQATIHRIFAILISSGDRIVDRQYQNGIFPVEWAVAKALYDWSALRDLEFTDPVSGLTEKFFLKFNPLTAEEGLDEGELNKTLKGWTAVWQADAVLSFSYQMLEGG